MKCEQPPGRGTGDSQGKSGKGSWINSLHLKDNLRKNTSPGVKLSAVRSESPPILNAIRLLLLFFPICIQNSFVI